MSKCIECARFSQDGKGNGWCTQNLPKVVDETGRWTLWVGDPEDDEPCWCFLRLIE